MSFPLTCSRCNVWICRQSSCFELNTIIVSCTIFICVSVLFLFSVLYVPGSWSLVWSFLVLWFDQYCNNNNVPEHYTWVCVFSVSLIGRALSRIDRGAGFESRPWILPLQQLPQLKHLKMSLCCIRVSHLQHYIDASKCTLAHSIILDQHPAHLQSNNWFNSGGTTRS